MRYNSTMGESTWWKILILLLSIIGSVATIGYLYYANSSCGASSGSCLAFNLILLSGGFFAISLPILVIMFIWELGKKLRDKENNNENLIL